MAWELPPHILIKQKEMVQRVLRFVSHYNLFLKKRKLQEVNFCNAVSLDRTFNYLQNEKRILDFLGSSW